MRHIVLLLSCTALAGCTNLPVGGPAHYDISANATTSVTLDRRAVVYDYALVDISENVLNCLSEIGPGSLFASFGGNSRKPPAPQRIGIGDVLQISVFESSSGGLFIPAEAGVRPGNFVTIPSQAVTSAGMIAVPYIGEVRAAGRTTSEIKRDIETKLASLAVEPQIVVTPVELSSTAVSVIGDGVQTANKFPLRHSERVLDVIARAGGVRFAGHELFVTVQRKGTRATVYLPTLVNDPRENIYMQPGDTVYVYREQQKFVAVGALGSVGQTSGLTGQFPFEQERLSLTEAVAKAGGLLDARANASQVFVYRVEPRHVLEKMGVDVSRFKPEMQLIPTIYRANYRDPSVFHFAQRFPMRHRDTVYAANADSVELEKFLNHTRAITSTISGVTLDTLTVRDALRGGQVLARP